MKEMCPAYIYSTAVPAWSPDISSCGDYVRAVAAVAVVDAVRSGACACCCVCCRCCCCRCVGGLSLYQVLIVRG